jgi:DNA modification methylase
MTGKVQMPELHIEYWPVSRLVPYAGNPRKNDVAVPRMVEALREFGFRIPILAKSDGGVIDGHLRLKAALEMGLESVPVITADDLTPEQIRAFRILVNKSASWAQWDEELLITEIRALQAESFDVRFSGFDMGELERLLADVPAASTVFEDELVEAEVVPESPANPVTRLGNIWQLGDHAIACADAADVNAVSALMDIGPASLCFTSPPYGSQREYTQKIQDWDLLMQSVFRGLPVLPDGQVLVNLGLVHRDHEVRPYWNNWIEWMQGDGWRFFAWYVWDQGYGLPGDWNGRLAPCHEFIFHFNRQTRRPNKIVPCIYAGQFSHLRKNGAASGIRNSDGKVRAWTHENVPTQDFRIPDSIVRVGRQCGSIGKGIDHPAVFPIAFPEYIFAAWAQPGDVVYEPFCGSGTAVIAGQRKGVKVRAVEIAPGYVDVALIRFSRFFPEIPITLRSTGESFLELTARRKEVDHA